MLYYIKGFLRIFDNDTNLQSSVKKELYSYETRCHIYYNHSRRRHYLPQSGIIMPPKENKSK